MIRLLYPFSVKQTRSAGWVLLFAIVSMLSCGGAAHAAAEPVFRILHIMSFDSPWRWTDGQFDGFKAGFGHDNKVEYKVFQLDTKRHSSPESKALRGALARKLVADWKPDLVYVTDDDAVELVVRHYLNTPTPFVFSGVNRSAEEHGLGNASNVTGVLEREHISETVKLLQSMLPGARRIHIVTDTALQWPAAVERVERAAKATGLFEVAGVSALPTWKEFQRLVLDNPLKADAYLFLGIFAYKDSKGETIPYKTLQRWFVENSKMPDITFWEDRVHHGFFAGVTISAFEQGLSAGKLARLVLLERRSPASLPIAPTTKGATIINLARARQLGITPSSTLLLSSGVVTAFPQQKP